MDEFLEEWDASCPDWIVWNDDEEFFLHYVGVFDEFLHEVCVFEGLVFQKFVCLLFADFFDFVDVVVDVEFFGSHNYLDREFQ